MLGHARHERRLPAGHDGTVARLQRVPGRAATSVACTREHRGARRLPVGGSRRSGHRRRHPEPRRHRGRGGARGRTCGRRGSAPGDARRPRGGGTARHRPRSAGRAARAGGAARRLGRHDLVHVGPAPVPAADPRGLRGRSRVGSPGRADGRPASPHAHGPRAVGRRVRARASSGGPQPRGDPRPRRLAARRGPGLGDVVGHRRRRHGHGPGQRSGRRPPGVLLPAGGRLARPDPGSHPGCGARAPGDVRDAHPPRAARGCPCPGRARGRGAGPRSVAGSGRRAHGGCQPVRLRRGSRGDRRAAPACRESRRRHHARSRRVPRAGVPSRPSRGLRGRRRGSRRQRIGSACARPPSTWPPGPRRPWSSPGRVRRCGGGARPSDGCASRCSCRCRPRRRPPGRPRCPSCARARWWNPTYSDTWPHGVR